MNILYIHGLNSTANSRTAKLLEQYLPTGYKVIAPSISVQPDVALATIKNAIKQHHVNLVVASSLGVFLALKLRNVLKIVINPCCDPGLELPKLGVNETIVERYQQLQKSLWSSIDAEERELCFGLFGMRDELFSYRNEFAKHYNNVKIMPNEKHRISPTGIKNILIPLVEYIQTRHLPELSMKLDGVINESSMTLNETYVNALTPDDMQQYAKEVWKLLNDSYKYCGGLLGMNSVKQLIDESDMWKMVHRNGKIVCCVVYTFKRGGRKLCYGGTDGTPEGKDDFYKLMQEDINLKDRKAWDELSGKMEHLYIKHGAVPIPSQIAKQILYDKDFVSFDPDGYHYTRNIGGILATKIMVGNMNY